MICHLQSVSLNEYNDELFNIIQTFIQIPDVGIPELGNAFKYMLTFADVNRRFLRG